MTEVTVERFQEIKKRMKRGEKSIELLTEACQFADQLLAAGAHEQGFEDEVFSKLHALEVELEEAKTAAIALAKELEIVKGERDDALRVMNIKPASDWADDVADEVLGTPDAENEGVDGWDEETPETD